MATRRKFTFKNERALHAYLAAKATPCGNLHQRMKYLRLLAEEFSKLAETSSDDRFKLLASTVLNAALDLQTEVAYMEPAKPPFGQRAGAPGASELLRSA